MAKFIKISLITLVSIFLLALAGIFILINTLDTDTIKQQVSTQFYQATGRTITLAGDIHFSIFPNISAQVADVSINNPANFSATQPLVTVEQVQLNLKLLPLLRKNVQIQHIIIDNPNINLLAKTDGSNNWSDWGEEEMLMHQESPYPNTYHDTSGNTSAPSSATLNIAIESILLKNGIVSLEDQQTQQQLQLSGLTIDVSNLIASSKQVDGSQEHHFTFKGNLQIPQFSYLAPNDDIALDFSNLAIQFPQASANASFQNGKLKTSVTANGKMSLSHLTENELVAENFELLVNELQLFNELGKNNNAYQASLKNSYLLIGSLRNKIEDDVISLESLNFNIPSLNSHFLQTDNKNSVSLNTNATLRINHFSYANQQQEQHSKLSDIELDLGRLHYDGDLNDSIPVILSKLDMSGELTVEQLNSGFISLSNINTSVHSHDGVTTVKPIKADFVEGNYLGELIINATTPVPHFTTQHSLQNVVLANLIFDEKGDTQVDGLLNANINLSTAGENIVSIKRNLSGTAQLDLRDGALYGMDLNHLVNSGVAILGGQSEPSNDTKKTVFSELTGTLKINNGIADNNDLLLLTPILRATGRGNANLNSNTINYQGEGQAIRYISNNDDDITIEPVSLGIPFLVTGTLTDPTFGLDKAKLLSNIGRSVLDKTLQNLLSGEKDPENLTPETEDNIEQQQEPSLEDLFGALFGQ